MRFLKKGKIFLVEGGKIKIILVILLISMVCLFLIFYGPKTSELEKEKRKDNDESLSLSIIPALPTEVDWFQSSNKEFKYALIVDNSDFVEKREDVKEVYVDLTSRICY